MYELLGLLFTGMGLNWKDWMCMFEWGSCYFIIVQNSINAPDFSAKTFSKSFVSIFKSIYFFRSHFYLLFARMFLFLKRRYKVNHNQKSFNIDNVSKGACLLYYYARKASLTRHWCKDVTAILHNPEREANLSCKKKYLIRTFKFFCNEQSI